MNAPNDTTDLRIVFAGTPEFASVSLQELIDGPDSVVAVFTQPDRRAGRGRQLKACPVKELASAHGIPVHQPASLKDGQAQDTLQELAPDILVVAAYGLILPAPLLTIPRLGAINVHASILPRWRGASPIQHAILMGDTETGISIMQMDKGLDTGDVLHVRRCPVRADDTSQSLHDRLAPLGAMALSETLERLRQGEVIGIPQDNTQACYAPQISKTDARLDWCRSAVELERQVRAYQPWPVAHTTWGDLVLRVWDASASELVHEKEPGTILEGTRDGLIVACGKNAVVLTRVQLPGRRPVPVADFLNAHDLPPGQRLGG